MRDTGDELAATDASRAGTGTGRGIIAGMCASLIGIGLARFAYTPLLPALIKSQWFTESDAVYLGAANLAGYLVGALLGRPLARHLGNVRVLCAAEVLTTISLAACAFPVSVAWFFVWRLLSGITGGAIMVVVAATVLPNVPERRKGLAGGAVFLGVGVGIALSGTLVPFLLEFGLRQTWLGLAALSAILTLATWNFWPARKEPAAHAAEAKNGAAARGTGTGRIYIAYGLMAFGLVPPMVFLVDFVTRGLGAGTALGSLVWVLYGLGAMAGPPLYGFLADRLGGHRTVYLVLAVQAAAIALLSAASNHLAIAALAVVIGSFPPGIVPLALTWIRQSLPGEAERQNLAWSRATIAFAAFQAAGGYAYSAIFTQSGGDHRLVFLIGALVIFAAIIIDAAASLLSRRKSSSVSEL